MQEPRGKGGLLEQRRRRKGQRVRATCRKRRKVRGERIEFIIIIIIGNATVHSQWLVGLTGVKRVADKNRQDSRG